MPTLLNRAGIAVPATVDGLDLPGQESRPWLYGEHGNGERAGRMLLEGTWEALTKQSVPVQSPGRFLSMA